MSEESAREDIKQIKQDMTDLIKGMTHYGGKATIEVLKIVTGLHLAQDMFNEHVNDPEALLAFAQVIAKMRDQITECGGAIGVLDERLQGTNNIMKLIIKGIAKDGASE